MIKKLESVLFFIFVLSLPIQLGKHFWPAFAYVSGIRIDYLSPTIYISDCVIILLFCLTLIKVVCYKQKASVYSIQLFLFVGILIDALVPFFITHSFAILWGTVKGIEFMFIGWYIAQQFSRFKKQFLLASGISVLWVSFLSFIEFAYQHSIGGFFYFLGERTFSSSTLGIATFSWNGIQILRPYATFPHPNVLAFFLYFSILYLLFNIQFFSKRRWRVFITIAVFFGSFGLFLTFSRILLLSYGISFLIFMYLLSIPSKWKSYFLGIFLTLFATIVILSARFTYTNLNRDFSFRQTLIPLTISIIEKKTLWGVGLNEFYRYEIHYQTVITPTFLQPVHNIYLLLTAQMGIIGMFFLLFFLYVTLKRMLFFLRKNNSSFILPTSLLFFTILIAGLFDHYFITLQQGELVVAFVLGIAWSSVMG